MFRYLIVIAVLLGCKQVAMDDNQESPIAPEGQDKLRADKLSDETEDLDGYGIHCYNKPSQTESVYALSCRLVDESGEKVDQQTIWSLKNKNSLSPIEVTSSDQPEDSPWHIAYRFSGLPVADLKSRLAGTILAVRSQGQSFALESSIEAALESFEQDVGVDRRSYIEPVTGGVILSIIYRERKATARVFVKRNGIQDFATDIPLVTTATGRFVHRIFYPCEPGDQLEVRFYGASQQGIQIFAPGPGEDEWYPAYDVL